METYFKINHYSLIVNEKSLFSLEAFSFLESTCLLGESGSGKSLFLHDISDRKCYQTNGKVSFVLAKEKVKSSWQEEISFSKLDAPWQDFCNAFFTSLERLEEKCTLVKQLLKKPDYLFCEDFSFSSQELQLLLKICFTQQIRFFYVTNDIESVVFFPYLMVLKQNSVVMEGKTLSVLKEEKMMKRLGYSLPFYVNLSLSLEYYGLISKIWFTKEELEESLWNGK